MREVLICKGISMRRSVVMDKDGERVFVWKINSVIWLGLMLMRVGVDIIGS